MPDVDLSVIVVNYNTAHLLEEMFKALNAAAQGLSMQVIIIDNASRDGSVDHIRQHYPEIPLIANDQNVGFGRANNQALPLLKGRQVLLLNTDAFVSADTLRLTMQHLDTHPDVGVLGVRLLGRDGTLQPSCRYFPTPLNVFLTRTGLLPLMPWVHPVDDMGWSHQGVRDCDWVPGCYYLMPRAAVDQVGLFDPRYFLYYEEVDHCRAIKAAGWRVVYFGDTSVVHIGGESAKSDAKLTSSGRQISVLQTESELLYFRKHHGAIGVWTHTALSALGDAILALKSLLKNHGLQAAREQFKHSQQVWALLKATDWATQATR